MIVLKNTARRSATEDTRVRVSLRAGVAGGVRLRAPCLSPSRADREGDEGPFLWIKLFQAKQETMVLECHPS